MSQHESSSGSNYNACCKTNNLLSQRETQIIAARSLFIHCGDSANDLLVRKRFWTCQGIASDASDSNDVNNHHRHRSRVVGVAAANVGPQAIIDVQTADHERIATQVRERRRRQLEQRAAELLAKAAAEAVPKGLSGEILEKLNDDENRRRVLLETVCQSQWMRLIETGRAAQIPIALGERKLGRCIALEKR